MRSKLFIDSVLMLPTALQAATSDAFLVIFT
jgi:hypothetical protein